MSSLVRNGGPWTESALTLTLADYAAHTIPGGQPAIYFVPFLGLELNAAFSDTPFRLGNFQSLPLALGSLSIWCDGADEPAPCSATFDVLLNGTPVPGLSLTVDLGAFSGTGTRSAIASPLVLLALDDVVSVRVTVADQTTGVPLLLFARVQVFT